MSVTVGIHPDGFEIRFFDKRPGDARPFASLEAREGDGTVTVYLVSAAQCDELIKAAVEAKRLLLGDDAEPCGDIAEHTRRSCELAPGHEGWHQSGMITWPWADGLTAGPAAPSDLAAAEADPANPYGSSKHGRFDAGSAAEVAEGVAPGPVFCLSARLTKHGHAKVRCTLPGGHDGDHVANGTGNPPASWPEGEDIDWDAVARAQLAPPAGYGLKAIEKTGGA